MVDVTRHSRQIVTPGIDFEWDGGNSRVWQIFRAYEYWFGRRSGRRFEGGTYIDELGRNCWTFGTWENVSVFVEGVVRDFFRGLVPKFEIVRTPQLATTTGQLYNSPFRFAIAFDNAEVVFASSTLSCVVSGSNGYMFGMVGASTGTPLTATFNSVSMTVSTPFNIQSGFWVGGVYLASPATGTHNFVSSGGNDLMRNSIGTYSGVSQSAPDQYVTNGSTGTSLTVTITTATANCWMFLSATGNNGTATAGTNSTLRAGGNISSGISAVLDSNGTITTGGFSMTVNGFSAQPTGGVAYSFQQVAATVNSGFFFAASR